MRRTNPRDALDAGPVDALELANLHRIIRRGRVYGPALAPDHANADEERGLVFACLNANIERQFEFVQHTWVDNPTFDGLRHETDPLIGSRPDGDSGRFTVPATPVRQRHHGLPRFVTTRGGAYFFLPGVAGLRLLAGADGPWPGAGTRS